MPEEQPLEPQVEREKEQITRKQVEHLYREGLITQEQRTTLLINLVPSIWASTYLRNYNEILDDGTSPPWHPRDYQSIIMDDTDDYKVLCLGRQIGKCSDADDIIQHGDGSRKTAQELYDIYGEEGEFPILSWNQETYKPQIETACIKDNGLKHTVKVSTKTGKESKVTTNHPYWVWRDDSELPEWVDAKDLRIGDRVATVRSLQNIEWQTSKSCDIYTSELLGILIGDACLSQVGNNFTSETDEIPNRINALFDILKYNNTAKRNKTKYAYGLIMKDQSKDNHLNNLLKETNLKGHTAHGKRVPVCIFKSSDDAICSFLSGIWATDGYVVIDKNDTISIGIGLCNEDLIYDIHALLLRVGIHSHKRYKPVYLNGKTYHSYVLSILDRDNIIRFRNAIQIQAHVAKQQTLDCIAKLAEDKVANSNQDTVPKGIWNRVRRLMREKQITARGVVGGTTYDNNRIRMQYSPTPSKLKQQTERLEDVDILAIADADIYWDRVTCVEELGVNQTYAFAVENTETLVNGNFITHNTVMLCIDSLFRAQTRPGTFCLIVTPYKTQAQLIYDNIMRFVETSPFLEIDNHRSNPFEVYFTNRSKISLFTAGVSTGGNANTIRGQCLVAGSMITLNDGSQKDIINMNKDEVIYSFNDDTLQFEPAEVEAVHNNGIKQVYEVILESGRILESTDEHPYYAIDGWKQTQELKKGMNIAIPRKIPFGIASIDPIVSTFLGYMAGDGNCYTKRKASLSSSVKYEAVSNDFEYTCDKLGIQHRRDPFNKKRPNSICIQLPTRLTDNNARNILDKYKMIGKYSYEKEIPSQIYNANRESLIPFINRLYSTDGWVCAKAQEIGFTSTSRKLSSQLQSCLLKFGIYSRLRKKKKFLKGKRHRDQWQVTVRDKINCKLFIESIGHIFGKESESKSLLLNCDFSKTQHSKISFPTKAIIQQACDRQGISRYSIQKTVSAAQRENHSLDTLRRINQILNDDLLAKLIESDIYFDKVVSIRKKGKVPTYNLTIKGTHTFIANDIVTHNTAHCLYIDEADYIDDASLDAIMMTTASISTPRVWMSSTPTGRKGYFYKIFHDDTYKTFQLPSHVSPTWNDDKDSRARLTLTGAGYSHEVLAEFGSNEEGVFRRIDITAAFRARGFDAQLPSYDILAAQEWDRKYIGVDWNGAQNGVQFAIIGVRMPKIKGQLAELALIEKHEIHSAEFTQTLAIEKIIELNARINPDLIFVDQGYGGMQIEVMHRYGINKPESGLGEKLQGIDFYGTTEIYDPILNEFAKKRNKHLMIDNLCRILERQMISLPFDELGEGHLEYQLINYSIARWTPTGQPVYECIGTPDHFFDSFLLGVNAFYMHEGAFSDPMKIFKEAHAQMIPPEKMQMDIRKAINSKIAKSGMPVRSIDMNAIKVAEDPDPGDPDPTRKIQIISTGTVSDWFKKGMSGGHPSAQGGALVRNTMQRRRGSRMTYE